MLIIKPVITEKTIALAKNSNQYTFDVAAAANKAAAAKELAELFKVKVTGVKAHNRLGKMTSFGRGRRGETKKTDRKIMVFKLKDGDKIEAFTQ